MISTFVILKSLGTGEFCSQVSSNDYFIQQQAVRNTTCTFCAKYNAVLFTGTLGTQKTNDPAQKRNYVFNVKIFYKVKPRVR